jgi:uncharacterized membrane protein YbhN (UPF0104 family)
MVSRERPLRLGATVAEYATAKRVRLVSQVLLLAGILFVFLRFRSLWHGNTVHLGDVNWLSLTGAFFVTSAGVLATGFIWLAILRRLGAHTRQWWTAIFFQSQLAKYIPGTLWQYAGRLALASARGLPTRVVARSLPIELAASIAGAGIASLLLLGIWGIPVAVALAACSAMIARRSQSGTTKLSRDISAAALAMPLYAIVWLTMGAAFWLTASGIFSVPLGQLPYYLGAFAAAWIVGVVAIYAPGGLGVREGVLIGLLHSRLGSADALVVAAASRVLLTLIDVLLAGTAFVVLRRGNRTPAADPGSPSLSLDPPKSIAP